MRYLSLVLGIFTLLFFCFFSACQSTGFSTEKPFNAYLPRPFDDYFKDYVPSAPQKNSSNDDVTASTWDVEDVDVSYIDCNRKLIAFTFDDAPSKTMEAILATFASFNEQNPDCKATATIFYNGGLIDKNAIHLVHTAHVLGMELGNHTQSHLDLTALSPSEIQSQIDRTDAILSRVDKKPRHLLRAPFGKINDNVIKHVQTPLIDWTIDTLDWTSITEQEIYHRVWNHRFSGAIVLMHDGYPNTMYALKRLLPDLKADGYQVVNVSAMAKMHRCILKKGSVYIRARKQT